MALADALQRHLGGNAPHPPMCDASVGECLQDIETESPERHGDMIAITAEVRRLDLVVGMGQVPRQLDNRLCVHHATTGANPILDRGVRAGLIEQLLSARLQRSLEGRPDLLATEMRPRIPVAPLPRHSLILTRPIPVLQSAPISSIDNYRRRNRRLSTSDIIAE